MIFYFRLARELGYTIGHLLQAVSSREIAGWMAFLAVEDEDRERKQAKEARLKLDAQIEALGKQAQKKKEKAEKWQIKKDALKSSGMQTKF